ncbi:MAG: hypothetical protein U9Q74_14390 [Gemmatimonadota bacterium]|nr:hypothetical protein [Gemmatimonadota bacterium]
MSRPDEGLIHAWLDGELDAAEAARVERLVKDDPEWAAAVAEARGFIAASDRILSALDDVPANVIPAAPKAAGGEAQRGGAAQAAGGPDGAHTQARGTHSLPWWALRAAAVLVVVAGVTVVLNRGPEVTVETGLPPAGLPPLPSARAGNQAAAPPAQASAPGAAAAESPKDVAAAGTLKEAGAAPAAADRRAAPPAVANEVARDEPKRELAAPGAPAANSAALASALQAQAGATGGQGKAAVEAAKKAPAADADRARQVQFRADAAKTVGAVNARARIECYRTIGGTDTLRVRRLSDSTAVVDAPAEGAVDAASRMRSNATRELRVRGDTLFAGTGTDQRPALKVTCPQP